MPPPSSSVYTIFHPVSSSIPPFSHLALVNGMRCILNLPGPLGIGIIALNRVVLAPDEKMGFLSQQEPAFHLFFFKSKGWVFFFSIGLFRTGLRIDRKCVCYTVCLLYTRYSSSFPKIVTVTHTRTKKKANLFFLKLHFVTFKSASVIVTILNIPLKNCDSSF